MADPMHRRLAAIIVADVVGYSRLTTIDEESTISRFNERVDTIVRPAIEENEGRFVKHTGDGFIGEFHSVAAAFKCASVIQEKFEERNAEAGDDRPPLELRIGLDIGDIIVKQGDVFGNGVNIAARLESLAEPGGICMSQRAREHLGQFEVQFVDLGQQRLKNISEPVHAYQVTRGAPGMRYLFQRRRIYRHVAFGLGAAVMAALALVAFLLWYPRGITDKFAFFEEQVAEIQCSWLSIDEFSEEGDTVEFSLVGTSVAPGSSIERTLIREAEAAGLTISRINVTRIAPMEPPQCELIEGLRSHRHTGISRLDASETTIGNDEGVRFTLVFNPDDLAEYAHIYSIDPDGSVILAEDREALVGRAERLDDGRYAVDYLSDHIGWGGILLMESDAPINNDLVLDLAEGSAGEEAFDEAADRDNWRFELVWLNSDLDAESGS